jgi:hypothetical protein
MTSETQVDENLVERPNSTKDLVERPNSTAWQDWMRFEFEVTEWQATMIQKHVEQRVAAERAACADICEGHYDTKQAARAIRARSEHG